MNVIFDMDGVITNTARVHRTAWKRVFDAMLSEYDDSLPPFSHQDYSMYIDGKSRAQGISSFLMSRDLVLDDGAIDSLSLLTKNGIANVKNQFFWDVIQDQGVNYFDDALRLIAKLHADGAKLAIGSSSKNAKRLLEYNDIARFFDVIIDGVVAEQGGVPSKPDKGFYLHCVIALNEKPENCVVIEDAISGITSATKAGIGSVIGVAREGNVTDLVAAGASEVVHSLDDCSLYPQKKPQKHAAFSGLGL